MKNRVKPLRVFCVEVDYPFVGSQYIEFYDLQKMLKFICNLSDAERDCMYVSEMFFDDDKLISV